MPESDVATVTDRRRRHGGSAAVRLRLVPDRTTAGGRSPGAL